MQTYFIKRRAVVISLAMLICFFSAVSAQDKEIEVNRAGLCISLVPQYFILSTLKLEIDKQMGDSRSWLVVSGGFTHKEDDYNNNFNFKQFNKYGLGVSYRVYPLSSVEPRWVYFQAGAIYNYSKVKFTYEGWGNTLYNGSAAITFQEMETADKIIQYGTDMKFGVMIKAGPVMFFDFYMGVGLRWAEIYSTEKNHGHYDGGILSPAYQGMLPVFGVRFGVNL